MTSESAGGSRGDEVLACAFAPDNRFVLSGGWDGHLRLWDPSSGKQADKYRVGDKPVSACAVSPDGKHLLAGTLEGLLSRWDVVTHEQVAVFLAHSRPVSAILFGVHGRTLITASWDCNLAVWKSSQGQGQGQDGRILSGHRDIVAGCAQTPDGSLLLSWSHDASVRLWDAAAGRPLATLQGHTDRVLAGDVSPDGRWGASGSRDHVLKLWDLPAQKEVASRTLTAEIRSCLFLRDGLSLVVCDANGRLGLYSLPDLQEQGELQTRLPIQCAALAPSGAQLAFGCADGQVCFVAVDGFDGAPLLISVTQCKRRTATKIQRLFGRSSELASFLGTCPVCRASFELPSTNAAVQAPCPNCHRALRISTVLPMASES